MGASHSDNAAQSPTGRNRCGMASASGHHTEKVTIEGTEYELSEPDHVKNLFDAATHEDPKKDDKDKPAAGATTGAEKPATGGETKEKAKGEASKPAAPEPRITYAKYEARKEKCKSFLPYKTSEKADENKTAEAKFKTVFLGDDKDGGLTFADFKKAWVLLYGTEVKKPGKAAAAGAAAGTTGAAATVPATTTGAAAGTTGAAAGTTGTAGTAAATTATAPATTTTPGSTAATAEATKKDK